MVFGCTGQDGSLTCYSLLKKGYTVIGISRKFSPDYKYLKKLDIDKSLEIKQLEIEEDLNSYQSLIDFYKPDEIYNLAAQSSVGFSFKEPHITIKSIYHLTLNILEAARKLDFEGTIFFAGSSEIFGETKKAAGINHPKNCKSPYALAKEASMNLVRYYREVYNLNCITGILFNHESSLRNEKFVIPKIIKGAKKCKKDKNFKLLLGNIEISRDWGWAEDYVEAMQIITRAQEKEDFVICTGILTPLIAIIDKTFRKMDMNWQDYVVINKNFTRSFDISQSFGDPKPLKNKLGWQSTKNIDEIIDLLLDL